MSNRQKRPKSQDIFDSLVRNAIDFVQHSVAELEESPKYSVINFYAAIELFLKARLMLEHWSLVYREPKNGNLAKFLAGDFESVDLAEAVRRLECIANVRVTEKERKTFNQLREHRNKLIHFFHPEYAAKTAKGALEDVVSELCRGWYYLHEMLTRRWQKQFRKHLKSIRELNRLMLDQRTFLKVRYEALVDDIQKAQERGIVFNSCWFCGFEATREEGVVLGPLVETVCLVCGQRLEQLKTCCPSCKEDVLLYEVDGAKCDECGATIELEYLLDLYGPFASPKDESIAPTRAYCAECWGVEPPTVVPLDGEWLCLRCLTRYNEAGFCGWCGDFVTGDLDDSYLQGCARCEGRLGS